MVNTWFEKDGHRLDTLTGGEVVVLVAEVAALNKVEYVMVEVPIPGGCSYGNKDISSYSEVHREYFRNKTAIFVRSMRPGTYQYRIELQPRFTCVFSLNPAHVELMYFPTFYRRNGLL